MQEESKIRRMGRLPSTRGLDKPPQIVDGASATRIDRPECSLLRRDSAVKIDYQVSGQERKLGTNRKRVALSEAGAFQQECSRKRS